MIRSLTPFRLVVAASILWVGLLPARSGRAASPGVTLPSPAALNALLSLARNPGRDLLAIAERLKLHAPLASLHLLMANLPVGHTDAFYVANSTGSTGYTLEKAHIAYKTPHAYFYVQDGTTVPMAQLISAATVFERKIYPTDTGNYGSDAVPGLGDQHVSILNGQVPDVAGYVSYEDLFPRSVNPFSNQRKMIYLNLAVVQPGTDYYNSTLSHEFQHVIHVAQHPADEGWINEGSSVLAQVLNGYTASGLDADKLNAPDTQLDTWMPANTGPSYGGGFLWMLYLYEHFGGPRVTRAEMGDSGLSNMALFDDLLAKLNTGQRADTVFADWTIANFLNDRSLAGGRYGYVHTALKSVPTSSVQLPFAASGTMHQYAANYVDIPATGGAAFTLHFGGTPTVPVLNTLAPAKGFWWSNRADNVDDTLNTPALDLRGVKHATLKYQAWYDLEQDFDYGYVEVSPDGGKDWYAQRTARTTTTNPNGSNVGDGYTGSSCNATSRPQHCWINEQVDLSPYSGKQVLVRFEQLTDDVYNGQGLAIAHIQVPEIGFDGDSTASGWQPAGWVRIGNTLVQHWIVQAIIYGARGLQVLPMAVDASGRGTLPIPAGSSRVVVAVSPMAPLTTITNTYTLSGAS